MTRRFEHRRKLSVFQKSNVFIENASALYCWKIQGSQIKILRFFFCISWVSCYKKNLTACPFCFAGYFECMKEILDQKVPSSLERSTIPPTPVAASVLDLIMSPVSFATATADKAFRSVAVDIMFIFYTTPVCHCHSGEIVWMGVLLLRESCCGVTLFMFIFFSLSFFFCQGSLPL